MNYSLQIILVVILFTLTTSCDRKTVKQQTEAFADVSVMQVDEAEKQLSFLTDRIRRDSLNHQLYFQRAMVHHHLKQHKLALYDILMATDIDSANSKYLNLQGEIMWALRSPASAIISFEKSKKLDSTITNAYLRLGEVYLYTRNHEKSFQNLNSVLYRDRTNPKAYFLKGMNYKEVNDTFRAIAHFQTATEMDPYIIEAYIQLGLIYASREDHKALASFNNALRINPVNIEALFARGCYYQKIDSFNHAVNDYEKIIELDPSNRSANYNLAYIKFISNDYKAAEKYFSKAIEADSSYTYAFFGRGLAYKEMGKKQLARADFNKVLELDPAFEDARAERNDL
jgi:Tfp pilus assembly protein PilF